MNKSIDFPCPKCGHGDGLFEKKIAGKNRIGLLDAKQLSEALSVSVWTIRKWRAEKRIPFIRLGRSIRYNLSEVIASFPNEE